MKLDWWERRAGPFVEELHGPLSTKRRLPRNCNPESVHRALATERHHFNEAIYLAGIPGAHLFGPSGVVVTADGGIVEESTWGAGYLERDRVCKSVWLPRPEKLPGRYYTLATVGATGYYHWFLDVLPRLLAWDRIPNDDVKIIINDPLRKWQEESLRLLNLDHLHFVELGNRHLQVEFLYFPSFLGAPSPHPLSCQWLRDRLLRNRDLPSRKRRLYLSRGLARGRRLRNEEELRPVLSDFGFEVIQAESLALQDQIDLFSNAEAVVGPHGAGFTNILFAPPGCRVLEIFEPGYVQAMYFFIADILELPYWYLLGDTVGQSLIQHQTAGYDDIWISSEKLRQSLQAVLA